VPRARSFGWREHSLFRSPFGEGSASTNHTFKLARRMARWRPRVAGQQVLTPVTKLNSRLLQLAGHLGRDGLSSKELALVSDGDLSQAVNLLPIAGACPSPEHVSRGARVGQGLASVAPGHPSSRDGARANG
jgi:hypothetical protein